MSAFNQWWRSVYADSPKEIHRQCYEEGYDKGYLDGVAAVHILRYVIALAAICAFVFVFK